MKSTDNAAHSRPRAERRRAAKEQEKAIAQGLRDQEQLNAAREAGGGDPAQIINITMQDVTALIAENPLVKQALVNIALRRELLAAKAALAVYEKAKE